MNDHENEHIFTAFAVLYSIHTTVVILLISLYVQPDVFEINLKCTVFLLSLLEQGYT